jgi:hypothetical protein
MSTKHGTSLSITGGADREEGRIHMFLCLTLISAFLLRRLLAAKEIENTLSEGAHHTHSFTKTHLKHTHA